jgi:hypothetical protein
VKITLCCLALGVFPLPGQIAAIAVYSHYQNPPAPAAVAQLQSETAAILAPLGLELSWKSLDHPNQVSAQLAVVTLRGTCDARGVPPAPFRSGGLGWTHISDGEVLPFMDVDCDRIRGFVRGTLAAFGPAERDRLLGRAIGRVIAHELYHILGRTTHHGTMAGSRPVYTAQELTSDRFLLEEPECRILHVSGARIDEDMGSSKRGQDKYIEKKCGVCHGPKGEGTHRAPTLRVNGRFTSAAELAMKLALDAGAMCRSAGHLKIASPSLDVGDIADLVRFLNTPVY